MSPHCDPANILSEKYTLKYYRKLGMRFPVPVLVNLHT